MPLSTLEADTQSVTAGYTCPCGCTPSVSYQRGGDIATSRWCCGNEFAVGLGSQRSLQARDGFALETEHRTTGFGRTCDGSVAHRAERASGPLHGRRWLRPGAPPRRRQRHGRRPGLQRQHEGLDHYFCGKGCYLEFGDDPGRYLDPSWMPSE